MRSSTAFAILAAAATAIGGVDAWKGKVLLRFLTYIRREID